MHGNFSSQYSEGSSNLSAEEGLMTHFLFFFFLSVKNLLAVLVQQDRPQTWHHSFLESFIYLEFHARTGHTGDSDSPYIFSGMFSS